LIKARVDVVLLEASGLIQVDSGRRRQIARGSNPTAAAPAAQAVISRTDGLPILRWVPQQLDGEHVSGAFASAR